MRGREVWGCGGKTLTQEGQKEEGGRKRLDEWKGGIEEETGGVVRRHASVRYIR